MRTVVIAGPPGSGKTALARYLARKSHSAYAKIDALSADEPALMESFGVKARARVSKSFCPDHIAFITFGEFHTWARETGCEVLLVETAGLCGRCSPFFRKTAAVCVLPYTANLHSPRRLGPMVRDADFIVFTRPDLVTFSERKVFRRETRRVNADAVFHEVNGITGEGTGALAKVLAGLPDAGEFLQDELRSPAPRGVCHICQER